MILVKKLIDPDTGQDYYIFYESGNFRRPLMVLDRMEYNTIGQYFREEVVKGD